VTNSLQAITPRCVYVTCRPTGFGRRCHRRRLLPAACGLPASNLLLYEEQNSGPYAYQRFQAKIVDRFGYQVRHVFNRRIRAKRYEPEDERHLISHHYSRVNAVLLEEKP
jgi:hypothetical protein